MKFGTVKPGNRPWDLNGIEALFEGPDAECGDVFDYGGKRYAVGIVQKDPAVTAIREIELRPDAEIGDEEAYEDEITCPFCGHKDDNSFEASESSDDEDCGRCGARFSFEREISVTYSTKLIALPKIVAIEATP